MQTTAIEATAQEENSYPRYPTVKTSHVASRWSSAADLEVKFGNQPDTLASYHKLLCSAYLLHHMGPHEFLDTLFEASLIGSLGELMHAYARGVLAIEAEKESD